MRPTVFHTFLNLVGVWEDFPIDLRAHPPYLHPFSNFTFEEVVGAEEPAHWEAPPEGNLNHEENMQSYQFLCTRLEKLFLNHVKSSILLFRCVIIV